MTIRPSLLPQENGEDRGRGHRDWIKLHTQSLWPLTQQLLLVPSSFPHILKARLLAAVAPISSCPWHCQGAFSSSSLLLLPESHLWNGRQLRHYAQDPHLGCPTGFPLKTPTSDLLAASVRPRELHDCRFCSRRTSSLKHSACSDAGWNS